MAAMESDFIKFRKQSVALQVRLQDNINGNDWYFHEVKTRKSVTETQLTSWMYERTESFQSFFFLFFNKMFFLSLMNPKPHDIRQNIWISQQVALQTFLTSKNLPKYLSLVNK